MPYSTLYFILHALSSASGASSQNFWNPPEASTPITASELGWGVPPNVTENTVAAFKLGLALGASSVEVTARLTKDGKIALHHNAIATNSRVVAWSNFNELPEGTLELATYFEVCKGYGMNIMVQNNGNVVGTVPEIGYDSSQKVADVVVKRVLEAGLQDKVLISAFNIDTVARVAVVCNGCGIRTAWLQTSPATMRQMFAPFWLIPNYTSSQYLDVISSLKIDAFNPENLLVDRALLASAQAREMQLFVWWLGINTTSEENPPRLQQLSDCGVTGFITPRVKMGVAAYQSKKPTSGKACEFYFGFGGRFHDGVVV